jgi:hypothetical protein
MNQHKIHFDLDGKLDEALDKENFVINGIQARDAVIEGIRLVLLEYNVPYSAKDSLLVFDSCGPTKQSYHIVIDDWLHKDNIQSCAFYALVMEKIKGRFSSDINVDASVYSLNTSLVIY